MKQAVLFDLDGTLWDSSEQVAASWCEALKTDFPDISVRPTGETLRSVMGKTLPDIARILFPMVSEARAIEAIHTCCISEQQYLCQHRAPLYEGIKEAISELAHEFAICIVSNCQEGYIEAFLSSYPELQAYISDTENAGRTGKPKWDNIQLVINRNDYTSSVYIGDTIWDCEAAKRANVPFLHAAYGFGTIPEAIGVHSPSELPAAIRAILK